MIYKDIKNLGFKRVHKRKITRMIKDRGTQVSISMCIQMHHDSLEMHI